MSQLFALITVCALAAFSLIYLSAAMPKKSPGLEKALAAIKKNIDLISTVAAAYGLVAFLAQPIFMSGLPMSLAAYMLLPMLANLVLIIMALPYMFHKIEPLIEKRLNTAIFSELKGAISGITEKEKIFGYAGAGLAFILLLIMLRVV